MRPLFCAALLALAASAHAAALSPSAYYELRQRAFALADGDHPAEAAAAFDSLTASNADDGAVWLQLGFARFDGGRFAEAGQAFRRAFALGQATRAEVAYHVARSEARAAHPDSALTWLGRAVALGYERRPEIADDSTFAALRSQARFRDAAGELPSRTFSRDEGWRYDLDFLVAEVRRMHYRYRAEPLPPAFVAGVSALRARVQELTDLGVTLEMQRLLAMLGDGHSTLYVGAGKLVPLAIAPVSLHAFTEGVYVLAAPDPALVGARVDRIGPHPVDEVMRRLEPYESKDNDNATRVLGPYFATFPAALHELGLIPSAEALPLAGVRRDGKAFTASIPAEAPRQHPHIPKLIAAAFPGAPPAPRALSRPEEPLWFESLPGDSIVWCQFDQVLDTEKESLLQFALRLRKALDEKQARVLIIDVRNNNGGNGNLLTTLVRTIVHFETTRRGARTFVITSPYTFSACQVFAAQLDRLTNAIFVGETTGSRPTFIGEDTELLLPWSGTRGSISSRLHQSSSSEERTWIAPEIPVPSRASDWLAGRDAALDAVLEVIGATEGGRGR